MTLTVEDNNGAQDTDTATAQISLPQVAQPTFNPDGGEYTGSQNVVVNCSTSGATIHYTTDGNTPTESDPDVANGGSVLVDQSLTLKAKAWNSGYIASEVKSSKYTIGRIVSYPMPHYRPENIRLCLKTT